MKKWMFLMVATLIVAALTACGGGNENTSSVEGETQDVVTLKLGHITGETDAWHKGALEFARAVEEESNGSVKVDVFPSSQLGNDRDLIEGIQLGTVDFALVAGVLSNFYEPFSILELPYLFRDVDHLEKVLYGEVGEELKVALLEHAQVRGLDFWMRGPRQMTSNERVDSVEDLRGIKVRVPEIPASIAAWEAMGASPTPMAFGEVYSSLQTGVIDAQENPLAFIDSNRMQEVQDYLMLTNHVYGYVMLAMSDQTWNKLTPEQQEAIEKASEIATEFENNLVAEQEIALLEQLQEDGMEVIEVDTEEFMEKAKTVHDRFAEQYGQELYDSIMAVE